MERRKRAARLPTICAAVAVILFFAEGALGVDDGARAYWKGKDGTEVVSFQHLNLDIQASGAQQFAPGQFIYPNADADASLFIANWSRHVTLFGRPSSFTFILAGGSVDVDVDTSMSPPAFLPPGVVPGTSFSESSSGLADPSVQLVVNLFGTPPLKSNVDLLNYEPTWTLDAAALLAFPIGEYDEDKLVNMGLNRWFGRVALPFKYHFGVFDPGHMTSVEVTPSVWLFADNDDFMGQDLGNDPMLQLEGHLTHDFTSNFFGSLDVVYRGGFQSEIDGVEVGDDLDIGNIGFTLNYQATDNLAIRTGASTNVFGDSDLDNSLVRIQFVYMWHPANERIKRLQRGH